MRKVSSVIILGLVLILQALPAAAQSSEEEKIAAIPRITQSAFKELMKAGKVIVVDVRDQATYEAGHIPGAIWMPQMEWEKKWNEFPKDRPVVTYCS